MASFDDYRSTDGLARATSDDDAAAFAS